MHPLALTARQVEQGQLAWGDDWSLAGRGQAGCTTPSLRPLAPSLWDHRPLTQSFMSCSVAAARRSGHLCRVRSGVYRAKECLASLSTGTSAVTSLRNTWRYCAQGADRELSLGMTGTAGSPLVPQSQSSEPWPAGFSSGLWRVQYESLVTSFLVMTRAPETQNDPGQVCGFISGAWFLSET